MSTPPTTDSAAALRDRYIVLLTGCLTRELFLDEETHDVDLRAWPGDPDELRTTLAVSADRVCITDEIGPVDWTGVIGAERDEPSVPPRVKEPRIR